MCLASYFADKTVLITGATGLIGKALVKELYDGNNGVKIIALVRDMEKARAIFGDRDIRYITGDVTTIPPITDKLDYIIHGAANTASKSFVDDPVGTMDCAIAGVKNLLDVARRQTLAGFVYLSTMEVYGHPESGDIVYENSAAYLDTMQVRSSYPEGKRAAEAYCTAYAHQFGMPVKIIRLTQTFGPGVQYDDKRVFAEFARCVIEGKDIVLKTKGETERSYLYIDDAVSAILTVLAKGTAGEAYNAANEATYCSVFEMAQRIAETFGNGRIRVIIRESDDIHEYAPVLKMNLSTQKLRALGWNPQTDLISAYRRLIEYMENNRPQ